MNVLLVGRGDAGELAQAFRAAGFTVTAAECADEALGVLADYGCDVMVSAFRLPDMMAFELARTLRQRKLATPLMVLDANASIDAKVGALNAGADDYLTLPCHLDEAAARLRALVRRACGQLAEVLTCGPVELDLAQRRVRVDGAPVALSPHELRLLEAMMLRPGRVLSKEALLGLIYGASEDVPAIKIIDVFACKIRKKLGALGAKHLETVWGAGYRMVGDLSERTPKAYATPILKDCKSLEVAASLLDALKSVAPRPLTYSTLVQLAGGASETTVRRALGHLASERRATSERAGNTVQWSAAA